MGNIFLINRFRPYPTGFKFRKFEFWCEYLCELGKNADSSVAQDTRFPVLIQERPKVRKSLQ
jgi:hypothetical protein